MRSPKSIMVVVDPTDAPTLAAQRAVKRGLELAAVFGARLDFIVCQYNQYISGERFFDTPALHQAREVFMQHCKSWLDRFVSTLDRGDLEITAEVLWDHPLHEGIVREVLRKDPDLVLTTTHYHPKLERALFKNTDWLLVRECPAPLMLVKTSTWPKRRRVLAAVDPMHEHDKPAALDAGILDHAAALARQLGAELHVFHSYMPILSMAPIDGVSGTVELPADYANEKIEAAHRDALDTLLEGRGIAPEHIHLEAGRTAHGLINRARVLDACVVVMGAVSRGPVKRIFLGSSAEEVLDDLACDVLVVKPDDFETPVEP